MTDTERSTDTRRGFSIVRHLDAPRELVFRAWTDPAQLHWFAGVAPSAEHPSTVDLRIGGAWRVFLVEQNDEARSYFTGGVYREIVPGERLVFSWGAVGGWPSLDLDRLDDAPLATVRLKPAGSRTEMVFNLQLPDHLTDEQMLEWTSGPVLVGWGMTIDRLVARYAAVAA